MPHGAAGCRRLPQKGRRGAAAVRPRRGHSDATVTRYRRIAVGNIIILREVVPVNLPQMSERLSTGAVGA